MAEEDEESKTDLTRRSAKRTSGRRFNYFWRLRNRNGQKSGDKKLEEEEETQSIRSLPSGVMRRESTFRMSGKRKLVNKPRQQHEVDAGTYKASALSRQQTSQATHVQSTESISKPTPVEVETRVEADAASISPPEPESTPVEAEVLSPQEKEWKDLIQGVMDTKKEPEKVEERAIDVEEVKRETTSYTKERAIDVQVPESTPISSPTSPSIPIQSTKYLSSPDSVSVSSTSVDMSPTEGREDVVTPVIEDTAATPRPESRMSTASSRLSVTKTKIGALFRRDSQQGGSTKHKSLHHEIDDGVDITGHQSEKQGYMETVAVNETVLHQEDLPPEVMKYVEQAELSQHSDLGGGSDDSQGHKIIIVKEIYTDRREKFRISGKKEKGYRFQFRSDKDEKEKHEKEEEEKEENEATSPEPVEEKAEPKTETSTKRAFSFFTRKQVKKEETKEEDGDVTPTRVGCFHLPV